MTYDISIHVPASRWLIRKTRCSCHPGQWAARLPGAEYQLFPVFELALRYAVDPRFRSQIRAAHELAARFRIPAGMKGLAL